jgi:hypothetical protein
MLNDGSDFVFHKDLSLLHQTDTKSHDRPANPAKSFPELAFFPEGGSLVAGVVNKIAFKATRKNGSPEEVKGVIRNKEGQVVAGFSSNHQGMGYFYLIPSAASTYTAECSAAAGNETISQTPLPPTRPAGIAMEVAAPANERTVTLRRSVGLSGQYYLLGTFYGGVTYLARINLRMSDTVICHVPVEGYLDGTLTLTVLDSVWTPLSECITFIQGQDPAAIHNRIDLSIEQKGLSPRGQNKILVNYRAANAASLSITATDAALPDDNSTEMAGYLSFSGQLKNYSSVGTAEDPDLLALTGEWKHSDWKAVLNQQELQNKYPPDTSYFVLSGKAINAAGKKEQLPFLIKQRELIAPDTLELTPNGSLCDSSMILFDTTRVLYRPEPQQKQYTFLFDQLASAAWDKYPFPDEPEKGISSIPASLATDTADLAKRFGKTLQAVTVTAPKRMTRMDSLENVYESDRMKHSNGFTWDLHAMAPNNNFSFFLRLLSDNVPDFPTKRYSQFGRSTALPLSKYIFLVDEIQVPFEALSQGAFPQVVFVKYFPAGQGSYGAFPLVAMYTEKYDFTTKKEKTAADPNEYIVTGYTQSQPYDALTWQPSASRTAAPDLRRTLYWNPSIYVDAKNKSIPIKFANNDLGGPIRIIIEGMDEDGNPIHFERVISNDRATGQSQIK